MRATGWILIAALSSSVLAGCSEPAANTAVTAKAPAAPIPAWATALLGTKLTATFPNTGACIGNVDKDDTTTTPSTLRGWAWDTAGKKPAPHILVVDSSGAIVGAGESGSARPDVPPARPEVTTPNVGWSAQVGAATGPVQVFGVIGADKVCSLGQMAV